MAKNMTIGETYKPAMEITDQKEADEYFEMLVQKSMAQSSKSREEVEDIHRQNLGYFAGYYDHETRLRVEKLFKCAHPIFGKASDGVPTPNEAFKIGQKLARRKETNYEDVENHNRDRRTW